MSAAPAAARVSAGRAPAPAVLRRSCACGPEVESALQELWSDGKGGIKPEFSFIAKDWRKYLFNVEDLGVF